MEQEIPSNLNRSFSEPDVHLLKYPYFRRVVVDEFYQSQTDNKSLLRRTSQQIFTSLGNINAEIKTSVFQIQNCNLAFNNIYSKQQNILKPVICDKNIESNKVLESGPCKYLKEYSQKKEEIMDVDEDYEDSDYENSRQPKLTSYDYKRTKQPRYTNYDYEDTKFTNYDYEDTKFTNYDYERTRQPESSNFGRQRNVRKLNDVQIIAKQNTISKGNLLFFIGITVAVIAYFWNYSGSVSSDVAINEYSSLNKILYQEHVKTKVAENLVLLNNRKSKKIMVFAGTTGVGKTYTATIIKKFFPKTHTLEVNFLLQSQTNIPEMLLKENECHLIIIDNLKVENLVDISLYISKIPDKCILVIPIFNIHDINDNLLYTVNYEYFDKIKYEFSSNNLDVDVILFNDINRDNLERWLREQVREKGLFKEEDAILSLLDEHDVEKYGFKGLLSKINILK